MIFRQVKEIIDGQKTQTRRVVAGGEDAQGELRLVRMLAFEVVR